MGYDLHITRREFWPDHDTGPAITHAEFAAVLRGDARFKIDPSDGGTRADYIAKAFPDYGTAWLSWSEGEIISKHPPREFIRVMHEIATKLGARVVGDEDEVYGADGTGTAE
ncbi:MAG: hypothetical protein ACKVZJ_05405 [Phycisphaerales bacterium]